MTDLITYEDSEGTKQCSFPYTPEEIQRIQEEGWTLSLNSGSQGNTWQVQRLDESGIFMGDPEAWLFLVEKSLTDPFYRKALGFIQKVSPPEFEKIIDYARNNPRVRVELLLDNEPLNIIINANNFFKNADDEVITQQASNKLTGDFESITPGSFPYFLIFAHHRVDSIIDAVKTLKGVVQNPFYLSWKIDRDSLRTFLAAKRNKLFKELDKKELL